MARASSSIHVNGVDEREPIIVWEIEDDDDDIDVSPPPTKSSRVEDGKRSSSSSSSAPKKQRFNARKAVCTMTQEEFERAQVKKKEDGFVRARRINREPRSNGANEKMPTINLHVEQPDGGMTLGELLRMRAGLGRVRMSRKPPAKEQPLTQVLFSKESFPLNRRRHLIRYFIAVLLAPPIPRLDEEIIEPIQITPFYAPSSTPRVIIPEPRQISSSREIFTERRPIRVPQYTVSASLPPQILPLDPVFPDPLPHPPKTMAKEEEEDVKIQIDPLLPKEEDEDVKLGQPIFAEFKEEEIDEEWEKWLKEHGEKEGDEDEEWSASESIDDDWMDEEEDDDEKGWRSRMMNERRARIYTALGLRMPPGRPHRNEIRYLRDKVKMKLGSKAEDLFSNGKERRRRK